MEMSQCKMEIVKNVMIELRPRLRCCNIFLTTTRLVTRDHLTITIRPDCIIFYYNRSKQRKYSSSSCDSFSESDDESNDSSEFINIKPYCKLVPGSLSNLNIDNESMSFRVLSEPCGSTSTGTIYSEFVNGNNLTDESQTNKNISLKVNLEKTDVVTVHCSNCSNNVSKFSDGLSFSRILELPSQYMDMSEWFCHAPGKPCTHHPKKEAVQNTNYKFVPQETDVFFGVSCFVVNSALLSDAVSQFNKKRSYVYCNRCLSHLGSKCDKDLATKFWNAAVDFTTVNEKNSFKMFSQPTCGPERDRRSVVLTDTISIINNCIKESLVGFQIPTTCKIILQTEETKKQYLLLWILDRCLQLLKSVCSDGVTPSESMCEIKICELKAAKVLYLPSPASGVLESEEWNNSSVQVVDVSKQMLLAVLSYLADNSKIIPDSFKRTSSYHVSYIFL